MLMVAKYGSWITYANIKARQSRSFMTHEGDLLIRWVVEDGCVANFLHDPWLTNLLLSKWPKFIVVDVGESMRISDLLRSEGRDWSTIAVAQLFGLDLAGRVLYLVVPIFNTHNVRLWRFSCGTRVVGRDLYIMFSGIPM